MPDYSEMMEKAKADTQCAMEVWGEILPRFFVRKNRSGVIPVVLY